MRTSRIRNCEDEGGISLRSHGCGGGGARKEGEESAAILPFLLSTLLGAEGGLDLLTLPPFLPLPFSSAPEPPAASVLRSNSPGDPLAVDGSRAAWDVGGRCPLVVEEEVGCCGSEKGRLPLRRVLIPSRAVCWMAEMRER